MRRLIPVSVILLAVLTIGLKIAAHDPPGQAPAAMEDRVASLLARADWSRSAVAEVTADGDVRVESFRHASCRAELRVMALPPRPDALRLADALSGDGAHLVFVYRGTVSGHPPGDGLLLYGRALRYLAMLRGQAGDGSAILAVAVPSGCPAAVLDWDALG